MFTLKLILDQEKDARNRRDACNKVSHGINRKSKVDEYISDRIIGKSENEAYEFLIPYLTNYYKDNKQSIDNSINFWQILIDRDINTVCEMMEKFTNTKIYRQDFVWYITTFPRGPYNFEKWYIWLYYNWSIKYYIWFFLHELLHFQFLHNYKNHPAIIDLNNQEFEFLKEALTVILNYEFKEFLWRQDEWYPIHRELRNQLEIFWQQNKNFEELVIYWSEIIKKSR